MRTGVDVCFADDTLVVVDKPAGLLAVPGKGEAGLDNLATRVAASFADALVVHRLDMATSGLIVFARGPAAQRALSRAFEARQVGKRYAAVVAGVPATDGGRIDAPLAADWPNRPRQQVDAAAGRPSTTHWGVLGPHGTLDGATTTRLWLEPVTGRSHQLRVHLRHIGHPIVGDTLYGGPPAARLMLHATRLELPHPRSGQRLVVESPVPFF